MANSDLCSTSTSTCSDDSIGRNQSSVDDSDDSDEQSLSSGSTSDSESIKETPKDERVTVRDELGPIPEVSVEFMLEHIVPDSNVDVNGTMEKLKEAGLWSEGSGWKVFEGHSPQELARARESEADSLEINSMTLEIEMLSRMKNVYNCIISYAQFHDEEAESSREPTLTFEHFPSSGPVPDSMAQRGPEYYGCLTREQEIHSKHLAALVASSDETTTSQSSTSVDREFANWFDNACLWAYKVNDTEEDLSENVLDMIWGLHRTMRIDHRRRFLFGITVENENTRIWFTCRQIVFVTRPFNFSTNASQLVQLIASLAYATPAQLGYDPTMKLRVGEIGFHYDIECTTKQPDGSERTVLYRTQKVLSDSAYTLQGRATRIYLASAVEKNDASVPSRLVVLKDTWIDAELQREGDTHRKLLDGASEEERKMFLTVFQHGVVRVDNQEDSTEALILKAQRIRVTKPGLNFVIFAENQKRAEAAARASGFLKEKEEIPPDEVRVFDMCIPVPPTPERPEWSPFILRHHQVPLVPVRKPEVHPPKVHYRIAFEEMGESLLSIANSGKATIRILERALSGIVKALQYMAKRGFVHRDVSPGNILWFGNHAKLSDLEFAKEYGTGQSSDARMGTLKFMSGEVMGGKYSVHRLDIHNKDAIFTYNPVHDLESLWWVAVWCTMWFYLAPCDKIIHPTQHESDSEDSNSTTNPQIEYKYRMYTRQEEEGLNQVEYNARELFCTDYGRSSDYRMDEILDDRSYASRLDGQFPGFSALTFALEIIGRCISSAYAEIQSGLPRTEAAYFTEVLRIGNPTASMNLVRNHDDVLPSTASVHDMIFRAFGLVGRLADIDDAILWPVKSMDRYEGWLEKQQAQELCVVAGPDSHAV